MRETVSSKEKGKKRKERRCLSCGKPVLTRRKKYCSNECKDYLAAQLERWSGLLVGLEARYANFWFTEKVLILDVLRQNSKEVLRFMYKRTPGKKPSEDYFQMANELGTHWWNAIKQTGKRIYAAKQVFDKAQKAGVAPESVKPKAHKKLIISKKSLTCLKLRVDDLVSTSAGKKIKSAYRREALKHHPDTGGSSKSFIRVQKAYEEISGLIRPQENSGRVYNLNNLLALTKLKAVPGKWCYDGRKRKWYKPALL